MPHATTVLSLVACVIVAAAISTTTQAADVRSTMRRMARDVWADQWLDNKNYTWPFDYGHAAGSFKNDIHINFVGSPVMQALRSDIGIADNNGFVTIFVLENLIAASLLAPEDVIVEDQRALLSLKTLIEAKNKANGPEVATFGFWPQRWAIGPRDHLYSWRQWSINFDGFSSAGMSFDRALQLILAAFGQEGIYNALIAPLNQQFYEILHAFNLPMDADDTGNILALDRLWNNPTVAAKLPQTAAAWKRERFSASSAWRELAQHAYCPRSLDSDLNTIDPRTYFWARRFFNGIVDANDCIVTTWIMNVSGQDHVWLNISGGPLMPFNVNNIDASVAANAIFGMTSSIIGGDTDWLQDEKAKSLYLTTADFIAWVVNEQANITRPDLQTLYYPNTMEFMLFVGRHVHLLESSGRQPCDSCHPAAGVLSRVREALSSVMRSKGTSFILQKQEASCGDAAAAATETCWSTLLGQGDTDFDGKPTPHHEDRFFTTGMALLGLLQTWTISNATSSSSNTTQQLYWRSDVPSNVMRACKHAANYLLRVYNQQEPPAQNGTAGGRSFMGAFFSGSVHGLNSLPLFFPANRIVQMNNMTTYTCSNFSGNSEFNDPTLYGVSGVMSDAEYDQQLAEGCGGVAMTPQWEGWNFAMSPWPFWSSKALTLSFALHGLSIVNALQLLVD